MSASRWPTRAHLSVALNEAGLPDNQADRLAEAAWNSPTDDAGVDASIRAFVLCEAAKLRAEIKRLSLQADALEKAMR